MARSGSTSVSIMPHASNRTFQPYFALAMMRPVWRAIGVIGGVLGALGLLLGSKGGRKLGGKALKMGSIAALGALAYKAYGQWQAQQGQQGPQEPQEPQGPQGPPAAQPPQLEAPRAATLLPAPEAELHSRAMLESMIAAAKADGHLADRERGLVEAELNRLQADAPTRRWLEDELRRPLDPADVAGAATTPEMAAEMYLAGLLVADETSFMERAYLDELARQLGLPEALKAELERQALAA